MNSDVIERTDVSHSRAFEPCINPELHKTPTETADVTASSLVTSHPSGAILEEVFGLSPYAAIRGLKVRCERDVVVVQGKVPSFYLRQIALAITKRQLPEAYIVDFIEVAYAERRAS